LVKFGGVKRFFVFFWWKPGDFTRCSPGFHRVFTRFWRPGIGNSPGFSPSFHQVLEIHQVFTKFSPGFHVFY
jgi:hypothetical protein